MFTLGYLHEIDREKVLETLSTFDWSQRATDTKVQLGCELPELRIKLCVTDALRALTKVGFNLLAFFCERTQVHRDFFPFTVQWIMQGEDRWGFNDVRRFGFVRPADVANLTCPPNSHKVRLTHETNTNTWKMYASFFGGHAAAHVAFPGPNEEDWSTLDVIAPHDKPLLAPVLDPWYRPLDTRAVIDPREIAPTIPWHSGEMRIRHEGKK